MEWSTELKQAAALVERLQADQCARWRAHDPVLVESYIKDHPGLLADRERLIDLVYNEFCLREELYGAGEPAEFLRRFPALSADLATLFALHSFLLRGCQKTKIESQCVTRQLP
jgi:hypothetical protein